MKIAILGFGTVGRGVLACVEHINDIEIVKILDRQLNDEYPKLMTIDYQTIIDDQSIDAVVECMGGLHPAYEYVSQAFKAHKHVVTSNKALVSAFYQDLITCANKNNVHFSFTSSAGGAIPWLSSLKRAKRSDDIVSVHGIVNGTSNYILDNMANGKLSFADALKAAQDLGYAEADPSADIKGYDTMRKCVISANIAFDTLIDEKDVLVMGIQKITISDMNFFKKHDYRCRLIMEASLHIDKVSAYVEPTLFDMNALESNVCSNNNLITFNGKNTGDLSFYGQGAGKLPTGNAIVQDLLDIKDHQVVTQKLGKMLIIDNTYVKHAYYLRSKVTSDILTDVIDQQEIIAGNSFIITKPISVVAAHKLACEIALSDTDYFMAGIKESN